MTRSGLVLSLVAALCSCGSPVNEAEVDELGGVTADPLLVVPACPPTALACPAPAAGTGASIRFGRTAASRGDVAQTFAVTRAGAPTSLRLLLRRLRAATGVPALRVTIREAGAGGVPSEAEPALFTGSVLESSVPRGAATVLFPLTPATSGATLAPGHTYAFEVTSDAPTGGTVLLGVGAVLPGSYSAGVSYRRSTRATTGAFLPAAEADLAFALLEDVTAPSNLTYAVNPAAWVVGTPITPNLPSSDGDPATAYSVAPALPVGLVLDPDTGAITGTPTAPVASGTWVVTATNDGGSTTCNLVLSVASAPAGIPNLVLDLDAGNAASYDGTGQIWRNLVASPADGAPQAAYHFTRGASVSSESEDPAFHGTAGGASANEYFQFDGAQLFRLAGSNPAFIQSMHRNNAAYTVILWVRTGPTFSSFGNYIGTLGWAGGNPGFLYSLRNGPFNLLYVGTQGLQHLRAQGAAGVVDTTYLLAASVDEASGAGFLYRNGNYDQVAGQNTFDATYASPATTDTACTLELGNVGCAVGDNFLAAGTRMYAVRIYNRALSKADLDLEWNRLRGRFGL